MIHMPIPEIISRIQAATKLSESDIKTKIDAKQKQLSGLVSQEGAAHIIANELGVKLIETVTGKLQIKSIVSGIRSLETVGRVMNIYELRTFKRGDSTGQVGTFVLGDETGTIRVVCWGQQATIINQIKQNDIVKIKEGYVRDNQGRVEIHVNERGLIMINPKNEMVGEVKASVPSVTNATRKRINELVENDSNVEIFGTIVQVFDPRFFEVCPQCQKRVRQSDNQFICQTHSAVSPAYSYVMNVFVDDGTDNIRVVCFRQQMEALLGRQSSEVIEYKDNSAAFEAAKNDLLGKIVKIAGRTTTNSMFGRLEFTAQSVIVDPDPQEEINRIRQSGETESNDEEGSASCEEEMIL